MNLVGERMKELRVNAVYLYDDKLVITFNYKEATKTVSLKEVNGSIIECVGVPKIPDTHSGIWNFLYTEGLERTARPKGGYKTVRWTVFRPWESPSYSRCTQ